MAEYDLVVRNGTLATASDVFRADLGVIDGRIATIGAKLGAGRQEINAEGHIVTPGGVDSHCHIEQRSSMGVMTADDFFTATRSAACGGTTTVIPFAAQYRGMSLRQVVKDYHACAGAKASVDYAFHLIISDPTDQVTGQELPALIKDAYTSYKLYMTYDALTLDDRQILEVLSVARRERALVMVHAENHDVISWLSERLLAAGHRAPRFHGMAHAPIAEREATSRAISLAELVDVPILIVHVSAREAMEQIRLAKARGLKVYGETCPQYLFLTADDLDRPGFEGAKYMCSPPPRDKANHSRDLVAAGIRRINVSLYTLDAGKFRAITRWGLLDRVLAGIDAAQAAGLKIKINAVALKGVNEDEFPQLIDWAHGRGMDLTLIEVMPLGEIGEGRLDQYLPLSLVRARLAERYRLDDIDYRTGGPARYVRVAETSGR